ncbi:glycosyltransferase [Tenacibaculum sp. M341]|nr:glycosyltransferase [Tenacibaculum sp. M341]
MPMKQVLIIGYVWVEPNSSAAGSRMLQLINTFTEIGYKVTFASPAQKGEKAIDLGKVSPLISEVSIELNSSTFDFFVKELNPDIVVFDRFMMEEQFGWRVSENCPNAIRVLDTEDLHFLRKVRHKQLKKGESFDTKSLLISDEAKREIAAILRCDVSLIISSYEMELLKNVFNINERLLLYLPFLLNKLKSEDVAEWLSYEERKDFVFVGNFFHQPNVDAVLQLKKIWKTIHKQLPKAVLHIYGAYATQQIQDLHKPQENFLVKGFAENAEEVVKKARVVLAPIRFGAGIKGKLTEGMICGTPSVTTNIGAEGMHANLPWNGYIVNDLSDFADSATALYNNELQWKEFQSNGVQIINTLYDKDKLQAVFINALKNIESNLIEHRQQNFLGSLLQHQTLQATKFMSKWIELKNKK